MFIAVDEADGDGADTDMDDFDRLRSIREQHRREKYLQKLMARSVSAQQVTNMLLLLAESRGFIRSTTQPRVTPRSEYSHK